MRLLRLLPLPKIYYSFLSHGLPSFVWVSGVEISQREALMLKRRSQFPNRSAFRGLIGFLNLRNIRLISIILFDRILSSLYLRSLWQTRTLFMLGEFSCFSFLIVLRTVSNSRQSHGKIANGYRPSFMRKVARLLLANFKAIAESLGGEDRSLILFKPENFCLHQK